LKNIPVFFRQITSGNPVFQIGQLLIIHFDGLEGFHLTSPPNLLWYIILLFKGGQIANSLSKCKWKMIPETVSGRNSSPHGGYTRVAWVAVPYQGLQFMGLYRLDMSSIFFRPPLKSTGRKPFVTYPKSLTVIGPNFDGGPAFIAENKHITAKRVGFQLDPAQAGQPVNATSEINGF
jgi:hypothetical protein